MSGRKPEPPEVRNGSGGVEGPWELRGNSVRWQSWTGCSEGLAGAGTGRLLPLRSRSWKDGPLSQPQGEEYDHTTL